MSWLRNFFSALAGKPAAGIDTLSRAQIVAVEKSSLAAPAPNIADCLEVARVAKTSPAACAGIAPGDLLVAVNGAPASSQALLLPFERRELYVFYCVQSGQNLTVRTTGIELGVALQLPAQAVAVTYNVAGNDYDLLVILWNAADWANLARLSAAAIRSKGRGSPPLLFLGVALYEQGEESSGMELIAEYLKESANKWTTNFIAIAYYYVGMQLIKNAQTDKGIQRLQEAFRLEPLERIAIAIERHTGKRPVAERRWFGRQFPDYALSALDNTGNASLKETLRGLKKHQKLAICLLATYRGNGPYNVFMRKYKKYSRDLSGFLPKLHIITMTAERRSDRPHWYAAEDDARRDGVPMHVLWDRSGQLTKSIDPKGSPRIFLVNSSGRVVLEADDLEGADLWDALASA